MGTFNSLSIASQGMTAQRQRLEIATSNLANASTTRTPEGGPYRRQDVVFTTTQMNLSPFASELDQASRGVMVSEVVTTESAPVRVYNPQHPDADAEGYVSMPDINPAEETVNILSAARSFESNATVFNLIKELARAALRLGE
jgi:flagellar basal-body rod protein FlgC